MKFRETVWKQLSWYSKILWIQTEIQGKTRRIASLGWENQRKQPIDQIYLESYSFPRFFLNSKTYFAVCYSTDKELTTFWSKKYIQPSKYRPELRFPAPSGSFRFQSTVSMQLRALGSFILQFLSKKSYSSYFSSHLRCDSLRTSSFMGTSRFSSRNGSYS